MVITTLAFVYWVVAPAIMFVPWLIGIFVVARARGESRISANSGFWAGHVLFVAFIVSQLQAIKEPTFRLEQFAELDLLPTGIGFAIGFGFLWAAQLLVQTRMVGVLTLFLSASASSALYSYVFIESLRTPMLWAALGTAFGALLYRVFSPGQIATPTP